jgi:isoleucyl-tRNA synthetase
VLLKAPVPAARRGHHLRPHVTLEAGTGLVHTAPAHGADDYLIGKVYGLPVNNPVGDDGRFLANTPALVVGELAGKTVWEANPLVLQELEANGRLLKAEKIQHSYPHCWRHKTPIIFRATTQWFIGMDHRAKEDAADAALDAPNARSTKRSSSRPGVARASKR